MPTAPEYEEITYEGYAPGGIALFIETLTDNRNRTAQDVRHAFTRNGGNLGETGSTAWMFTRKGVVVVEKSAAPDVERLLELALEGGAEDLSDSESSWEIVTDPASLTAVQDALAGGRHRDLICGAHDGAAVHDPRGRRRGHAGSSS